MKPGSRTLILAALAVVAGTVVELSTGGLSDNLLALLLGAPIAVGGRHLIAELGPFLARKGS
jgi:hypothetical protein